MNTGPNPPSGSALKDCVIEPKVHGAAAADARAGSQSEHAIATK